MSLFVTLKDNKLIKLVGQTVRCVRCDDDVIYTVWQGGIVGVEKGAVMVRMSDYGDYTVNSVYVPSGFWFVSYNATPGPINPGAENFIRTKTTCFGREHNYSIATLELPNRRIWVKAIEPIIL